MNRISLRLGVFFVLMFAAFASAEDAPKSADRAILNVARAISDNKAGPVWDALPASYQKDVTGLVQAAIGKVDAKLYDGAIGTTRKLVGVLKTQKKFILGNAMLGAANKDGVLDKNWDAIIGFYDTILDSDFATHEKAKAINLSTFADKTGSKLLGQATTMMKVVAAENPDAKQALGIYEKLKSLKATLVSETADSAVVRLELPGEKTEELTFTRVEGKWIPKDLADNWAGGIAQAKEALAGINDEQMKQATMMAAPMFAMVNGVLDSLAKAKTQEEFDTIINGMLQLLGAGGPPQE